MAHALLSPSSAHRWMSCPGSVVLEAPYPNTSSDFADEGTAAHELAAMTLMEPEKDCKAFIGRLIEVNGKSYEVDSDMASFVQQYVDIVRTLAEGKTLYVEQSLDISMITGEAGARGTSDVVIVGEDVIIVIDYKHGRGVQVEAEENPQLKTYGLGALHEFELLGDFKKVLTMIVQPRLGHVSEYEYSVEDLLKFEKEANTAAALCRNLIYTNSTTGNLNPGEKQCKFCKAKGSCPALRDHALATIADDFVDINEPIAPVVRAAITRKYDSKSLGHVMSAVDLIEDWCKAIRAETERELLQGREVPGFKLVQGCKGKRNWQDAQIAEQLFKSMRVKHDLMYDYSLISPTSAEKLYKVGELGKRQWPKVKELIIQPEGSPSVAPVSDKRPALEIKPVEDEFDAVGEPEACEDLI